MKAQAEKTPQAVLHLAFENGRARITLGKDGPQIPGVRAVLISAADPNQVQTMKIELALFTTDDLEWGTWKF